MSPLAVGALGLASLFCLILLQVPIGFAMIIVGVVGFALQTGWAAAVTVLANEPSAVFASMDLATLPLFLIMGTVASVAGFSEDLYNAAAALIGHRRGGLAYATIGGCAAFGAVCGSTTATAATFAKAALPEMLRRGYSPAFASGTIAAGGTLKALIPPSFVMILYCIIAKTSIFDLFIAAVVPALITIALNLAAIAIGVRFDPSCAPVSAPLPWGKRWRAIRRALPLAVLIAAVFGGFYSGVFTINEAASVAAILTLGFAALRRRLTVKALWEGFQQTAAATAMIYVLILGAFVFTYFITTARAPEALIEAISALPAPPVTIIFMLLFAYLVLGAVFDEISAMLITLPFVLPIIVKFGYDPVWWGVINVVIVELGMIIPPIGLIVFLLHGLAPDISMRTIYRGVTPFIVADMILLVLLTLFPDIALLLLRVSSGT